MFDNAAERRQFDGRLARANQPRNMVYRSTVVMLDSLMAIKHRMQQMDDRMQAFLKAVGEVYDGEELRRSSTEQAGGAAAAMDVEK